MANWEEWNECINECLGDDHGKQNRTRTMAAPPAFGGTCLDATVETQDCDTPTNNCDPGKLLAMEILGKYDNVDCLKMIPNHNP